MRLLACFILLAAPPAFAQTPLPVVASFSILGDMAQEIGGDAVQVTALVGPDGNSHGYQPTSADLKAVSQARLLLVNGLGFDSWMNRLADAAGYRGKLVTASAGIKPRRIAAEAHEDDDHDDHGHGHGHGTLDPHAWQDLSNGRLYAAAIAEALAEAIPEQAAAIRGRAAHYQQEIQKLDAEVRRAIAAVPEAQRVIVTSHDAFGYFGAAYGVKFHAPYGLSTESEPSARDIAQLVTQIRALGVKTVFIETMTSPRLIAQLGKDAGAKLGAPLYADTLSRPGGPAPHYLDMVRYNLPLLIAAMQENRSSSPPQ